MAVTIILDKSYLQGSKAATIRNLAGSHRLAVSDALLYELLTCAAPVRAQCFAKFPPGPNPVDLVSHVGTLMKIEIETYKPAGKPSSHRETIPFAFNSRLTSPDFTLTTAQQATIQEEMNELRQSVNRFIRRARITGKLFPNLRIGNYGDRLEIERLISTPAELLKFYGSLEAPPGDKPFPPAELVSEGWAIYRHLQVELLIALDVYIQYQGNIPETLSSAEYERMEHDVLDAQVLVLGCLEEYFATRETKLKRWWRTLCPNGQLFE